MLKHVLPNSVTPILVAATFGIPEAILASAALGFLGLGVQPPTPEWGVMVSEGKDLIRRAPYMIAWPGFAIMLIVLSFNFIGDGLRDALDPRLSREK
jgi:ABC-type dipeptide/oligopeptide/nickel transport system permease subunit